MRLVSCERLARIQAAFYRAWGRAYASQKRPSNWRGSVLLDTDLGTGS